MASTIFTILLAKPRGFCAGVDRAISIVESALKYYGSPIYVKHEIVHNKFVVSKLQKKGVIFIEDLEMVPEGSRLIFSAHGVSPQIKKQAKLRKLKILDATCPLVTKVHNEAVRFALNDYKIILIGHKEHVEVIGTVGHAPDNITVINDVVDVNNLEFDENEKLAFITQTTLSLVDTAEVIKALKKKYPLIKSAPKDDICYATTNRQNAVTAISKSVDMFLVIGSYSSSNTRRLVESAKRCNKPAYLIENAADVDLSLLNNVNRLGITAGASAPENLLQSVVKHIFKYKPGKLEEMIFANETIEFPLPYQLRKMKNN